jgi:DNA polymerase V
LFIQYPFHLGAHHAQQRLSPRLSPQARPVSPLVASDLGLVLNPAAGSATPRTRVAISFGSPASESGVGRLDLNDILVRHPQAAFLMRVAGSAMRDAGIDDGDLALLDRAVSPVHGHVVVAILGDEFVCRRLHQHGDRLSLQAADPAVAELVGGAGDEFQIWGVVTHVIKSMPV